MQQTAMKTPYMPSSLADEPSGRTSRKRSGIQTLQSILFSGFQDRWPVRSSKLFSVHTRNRLVFEDLQFSNHYQLGWDSTSFAGDYQTSTKEQWSSFITCVDWVQLLTRKEGHCLILAPFLWLQWCLSRNTFGLKTVALNWSSESS